MAQSGQPAQPGAAAPSLERKSPFRTTKSAAEVAMMDSEGYADEGLAQHKAAGGKHLEDHWKKGYGGLRKEGEDYEEEDARLHEMEARHQAGIMGRATQAVTSAASAAAEKAGDVLQAAKETVGLGPK